MASLGKTYEAVCSEAGKQNLNQPYMWLGIADPEGSGRWNDRRTGLPIAFSNWDDDEGNEGDTCARMLGNGKAHAHEATRSISVKEADFSLIGRDDTQ